MRKTILVLFTLIIYTGIPVHAAETQEARMTPWVEEDVLTVLKKCDEFAPYPRYQARSEWEKFKQNARFAVSLSSAADRARELMKRPRPALPASLYLDFQRTGRRTPFERILSRRSVYLHSFALAECVEGKGEFLDPIFDEVWAYCEESDWCLPAHTDGLVDMENPYIDLRASAVAVELALIDYVYGDALLPSIRKRIRYELERRIFVPYLARDDFFWLHRTHNWNAVCNGNILRAALFIIDDPNRLAKIVTKAQNAMCNYLIGFGSDGGTAEGLGYWNYGFSNYVNAAYLLNQYTNKRLNLFEPPIVKEIALFPPRVELSPDKYPSFSDGGENHRFSPALLCTLADSLDLPELRAFASNQMDRIGQESSLAGLFHSTRFPLPERQMPCPKKAFDYLSGVQWMISRNDPNNPYGLVIAAKGGSNDEPHNHNDVGNFIVHFQGESLIVDLGAPVYDRGFFSGKRYSYLAARSLGHSVPLINGLEQRPGGEARAVAKANHTESCDTLRSDITTAYPPEAGLTRLERVVQLYRDGKDGWVELIDETEFKEKPSSYETALMTYGDVSLKGDNQVYIKGNKGALLVTYDPERFQVDIQEFDTKEAKLRTASMYPTARRIAFQAKSLDQRINIHLEIRPRNIE